jgi:hypothetical protein
VQELVLFGAAAVSQGRLTPKPDLRPQKGILPSRRLASQPVHLFEGTVMHTTLKYLAAMAACTLFGTSASSWTNRVTL